MNRFEEECSLGDGELVAESEKALLVELDDLGEQWIPKSQVGEDSEIWSGSKPGTRGEVFVTRWFAEQKGWS